MTWQVVVSGSEEPNSEDAERAILEEAKKFVKGVVAAHQGTQPVTSLFRGNFLSVDNLDAAGGPA